MSVRIAVLDPLPVYRHGMVAALAGGGFDTEAPEDVFTWATEEQQQVVLLTLQEHDDWMLLSRLCQELPALIVVAVLTDVDVQAYVKALAAGAVAAVPRNAPPEAIKRVFEEAVSGASLLPIDVVRALAKSQERTGDYENRSPVAPGEGSVAATGLRPREVEWLRELARGITVGQLAKSAGYSERAMFRLLRNLYTKIHVRNRTEALIRAQQEGWL